MNLTSNPDISRKAAQAVQGMPFDLREQFVAALEKAESISALSKTFQSYLTNGYKPDKVVTTLEEALKGVVIEWEN
jgi:hypothetical protein